MTEQTPQRSKGPERLWLTVQNLFEQPKPIMQSVPTQDPSSDKVSLTGAPYRSLDGLQMPHPLLERPKSIPPPPNSTEIKQAVDALASPSATAEDLHAILSMPERITDEDALTSLNQLLRVVAALEEIANKTGEAVNSLSISVGKAQTLLHEQIGSARHSLYVAGSSQMQELMTRKANAENDNYTQLSQSHQDQFTANGEHIKRLSGTREVLVTLKDALLTATTGYKKCADSARDIQAQIEANEARTKALTRLRLGTTDPLNMGTTLVALEARRQELEPQKNALVEQETLLRKDISNVAESLRGHMRFTLDQLPEAVRNEVMETLAHLSQIWQDRDSKPNSEAATSLHIEDLLNFANTLLSKLDKLIGVGLREQMGAVGITQSSLMSMSERIGERFDATVGALADEIAVNGQDLAQLEASLNESFGRYLTIKIPRARSDIHASKELLRTTLGPVQQIIKDLETAQSDLRLAEQELESARLSKLRDDEHAQKNTTAAHRIISELEGGRQAAIDRIIRDVSDSELGLDIEPMSPEDLGSLQASAINYAIQNGLRFTAQSNSRYNQEVIEEKEAALKIHKEKVDRLIQAVTSHYRKIKGSFYKAGNLLASALAEYGEVREGFAAIASELDSSLEVAWTLEPKPPITTLTFSDNRGFVEINDHHIPVFTTRQSDMPLFPTLTDQQG